MTIPFEFANNNAYVRVRVGQSTPYWFILDTGDKYALIDLATAQSLGLGLKDAVGVRGASGGSIPGRFVENSRFSVVGLDGFSQPLFLALPLDGLAKATGHEFAGILGYDFLSQFIVEVNYAARTITFHDSERFRYAGNGESSPITFDSFAHPLVRGRVAIDGHAPIDGVFVADMGSSDALTLHTPFVNQRHLLPATTASISWPGGQGVGGAVGASAIGRIEALTVGHFNITHPVVAFAQATDGPLASTEAEGTIGADILRSSESSWTTHTSG